MTTIPRVRDLPDLLTVVPLLAGFTPTDAVVLVCPSSDGRVALQRISLPPAETWCDPVSDARTLASTVLPVMARCDLRRTTVVGYLSDPMDQDYVGRLVCELEEELLASGVDVMDVALVCEDVWWRPLCPCDDPECGEPRPVPCLHESAAATALVAEGAVVRESAEELLLPWVEPLGELMTADSLDSATTSWLRATRRTHRRRAALGQWARLVHERGAEFTDRQVAALVWALRQVPERDALIAWLTPGDLALEALDAGAWATVEELLGPPGRLGGEGHWSTWVVTENLRALTSRLPSTRVAPVACLAGIWVWWHGNGVVARFLLERALDAEPGHTLSGLVLRLVHHGIPLAGSRHLPSGAGAA